MLFKNLTACGNIGHKCRLFSGSKVTATEYTSAVGTLLMTSLIYGAYGAIQATGKTDLFHGNEIPRLVMAIYSTTDLLFVHFLQHPDRVDFFDGTAGLPKPSSMPHAFAV